MDFTDEVLDCVIVGGGPAGLTAGIYLRRFHRNVLLVDAGGGRATRICRSHNLAGFPQGLSGADLLSRMHEHFDQVRGRCLKDQVLEIRSTANGEFLVSLTRATRLTRKVILCTGVVDRLPQLPGIDELIAADLLRACPVCDGYEFSAKRIGVFGASLHGVEEASFLKHFSDEVTFVRPSAAPYGELEAALDLAKVEMASGYAAQVCLGTDSTAVVTMSDGAERIFDVIYSALGVDPRSDLASALGARLQHKGNIETDSHGRSSIPGLYAAGDVAAGLDQILWRWGTLPLLRLRFTTNCEPKNPIRAPPHSRRRCKRRSECALNSAIRRHRGV